MQDTLGTRFSSRTTGGFDYIRIILSIAVVYVHTWAVVWAGEVRAPYEVQQVARIILPMFFGLSGYLVAASLERINTLPIFLGMRFLRIFPALVVETILSALLLGPLVTSLDLNEYFLSPVFFDYFHNIYGNVRYYLPGVFSENPMDKVNASVWTVPFELECYILLSAIFILRLFNNKFILLSTFLVASVLCAYAIRDVPNATGLGMPGKVLVLAFLAGVAVNKFRDILPGGALVGFAMVALTVVMMQFTVSMVPATFTAAYAAAALGSTNPWRAPVILDGDYSYGVYLYAFPIQQLIYWLFESKSITFNFIASLSAIMIWAAFSWHCVEKPTLKLKSQLARFGVKAKEQSEPLSPAESTSKT